MIDKIFVYTDNEGNNYPVGSDTEAVSHSQLKAPITPLFRTYNLSSIWGGTYTLAQAITKIKDVLTKEQKTPGVHLEFTNSKGKYECWEYFGTEQPFENELGWRRCDTDPLLELQEKVFPLTVTLGSNKTLLGVGDNGSVKLDWSVSRKNVPVTSLAIIYLNDEQVTGSSTKDVMIDTTSSKKVTYTLTGSYQGLTQTATKVITVNDYSYFGIVTEPPTSLTTLTKVLNSGRGWTKSGINLNNQKTCYAYPSSWGALTSIKDGNNFEYIGSYTKTELTNDKGVGYFVYTLTNPTTITNFKQIYA